MKREVLRGALMLLPFLLFACNKDDGYVYPSVQLEFLTAQSGADGRFKAVCNDAGENLPIEKDHTRTEIAPDTTARIVANYELLTDGGTQKEVRIYTLLPAISPIPLPSVRFPQGVKKDPVEVQSIWMGHDYLNMVLSLQAQNKTHRFHFVEDSVKQDESGKQQIYLTLYHDAGGDVEAYTKRAYLSVPLWQYAQKSKESVLFFSLQTYDSGRETYCFDYKPTNK